MLPSDASCGGLEAYRPIFIGENEKNFETFWRASIHGWRKVVCYPIMPWCGREAYQIGVTDKLFLMKMGGGREVAVWKVKAIYLCLI